jgi:hypothetical protein
MKTLIIVLFTKYGAYYDDGIKAEEIVGTRSTYEKDERLIYIFSRKPARKRPFGRHGHRREDNIKVDLKRGMRMWTGSFCLSTGTSDGPL